MKKYLHLVFILSFLLGSAPVFADTISGNGYSADATITSPSYSVGGNGYSAVQTATPVYGSLEGNGYTSRSTSDSNSLKSAVIAGQFTPSPALVTPSSGSSGGSSGYVVRFNTGAGSPQAVVSSPGTREGWQPDAPAAHGPLAKAQQLIGNLWEGLGGTAYATGGGNDTGPAGHTSALIKTFNSKATFSLFSIVVGIMLFLALGVSVFGYNAMPKITSILIGVASIVGFCIVSAIYVLPAILSFICLIILIKNQQQREVQPLQRNE